MRAIFIILVLTVIACSALFCALNEARVAVDFYFAQITLPIGAALLGALLVGWLFGGLVAWLGRPPVRWRAPLRNRTDTSPPAPPSENA